MVLTQEQLQAIESVVRAVCERDVSRIHLREPMDLYLWTRNYGKYGDVDLVVPPGPVTSWTVEAVQIRGQPSRVSVVVAMYTKQEGRSDLSLELELEREPSGYWKAWVEDLHVL